MAEWGDILGKIKENISQAYTALEDKYYSVIDWLVEHGVPADRLVDAIESKGIPSLPVVALGLILILAGAGYGLYTAFGPKTYVITLYGPDGQPLANTTVYVNGQPYVTNAQGQLRLEGIEGPVEISAPGMSPKWVDPTQVTSISMSAEVKHVVINISDAKTGRPVSASVTVLGKNGTRTFNGYKVEFDISEYPSPNAIQVDKSGSVTATISANGYQNATVTINWDEGSETNIEKNVQLLPLTGAAGTVEGAQTSITKTGTLTLNLKPVGVDGYLKVFYKGILFKGPVYFDTNAGPTQINLPYGTYTMLFVPNINGEDFVTTANRITVEVNSPQQTINFTLTLPAPTPGEVNEETMKNITTEVNVLNARTNKPIAGAQLVDTNTGQVLGTSNDQGVIQLVLGSTVEVYVQAPGYHKSTTFTIGPSKQSFIVKLQPLAVTGNIYLTVVAPQGIPAPGATYTVMDENGDIITSGSCDLEGKAFIKGLPAEENIVVSAELPGTPLEGHAKLTLKANQTVNLKLLIAATESVRIIVEDAQTGEQISAYYKIAAGTQVLGSGIVSQFAPATLELPMDVPLTVVVKYGPGGKYSYTETVTLKGGETQLVIKVPPPEKSTVAIEGIFNAAGEQMAAITPNTPYVAKVLVSCSEESCSWDVKASGLSVDQDKITISCHSGGCAQQINLVVKAGKVGIGKIIIGDAKVAVAVGAPIMMSEVLQSGAVARVAVIDPDTNTAASKTNLEALKTYRFIVVAAAHYTGSSVPGALLQTGAIKITKPYPVATAAEDNLFVFAEQFEGMYPSAVTQPTQQYISVSIPALGVTPSDSVWFIPLNVNNLQAKISPQTIVRSCSGYQEIQYVLTDRDGKEPEAQHYMAVINGESVELSGPSGTLKIPEIDQDKVTITFAATGYGTADATLSTESVSVTNASGSFTYDTTTGTASGALQITLSNPNVKGIVPEQKIPADGWIFLAEGEQFTGSGTAKLSLVSAPSDPKGGTVYGTVDVNVNGGAGWCGITGSAPIDVTVNQGALSITNAQCTVNQDPGQSGYYDITVSFMPVLNNPITNDQDVEAKIEGTPALTNSGEYTYTGTTSCQNEKQTITYKIIVNYEGQEASTTVSCTIPSCNDQTGGNEGQTGEKCFSGDVGYCDTTKMTAVNGNSSKYEIGITDISTDLGTAIGVYWLRKGAKKYTTPDRWFPKFTVQYDGSQWSVTPQHNNIGYTQYEIYMHIPNKNNKFIVAGAGTESTSFICIPGAILDVKKITYDPNNGKYDVYAKIESCKADELAGEGKTISFTCDSENTKTCTAENSEPYTLTISKISKDTVDGTVIYKDTTGHVTEEYRFSVPFENENCTEAAKSGTITVSYQKDTVTVAPLGCSSPSTEISDDYIKNGCQSVTLKGSGSKVGTCVGEIKASFLLAPYRFPKVMGPDGQCEYLCSGDLAPHFISSYYEVVKNKDNTTDVNIVITNLGSPQDAQLCTATWCGPVMSFAQLIGYVNAAQNNKSPNAEEIREEIASALGLQTDPTIKFEGNILVKNDGKPEVNIQVYELNYYLASATILVPLAPGEKLDDYLVEGKLVKCGQAGEYKTLVVGSDPENAKSVEVAQLCGAAIENGYQNIYVLDINAFINPKEPEQLSGYSCNDTCKYTGYLAGAFMYGDSVDKIIVLIDKDDLSTPVFCPKNKNNKSICSEVPYNNIGAWIIGEDEKDKLFYKPVDTKNTSILNKNVKETTKDEIPVQIFLKEGMNDIDICVDKSVKIAIKKGNSCTCKPITETLSDLKKGSTISICSSCKNVVVKYDKQSKEIMILSATVDKDTHAYVVPVATLPDNADLWIDGASATYTDNGKEKKISWPNRNITLTEEDGKNYVTITSGDTKYFIPAGFAQFFFPAGESTTLPPGKIIYKVWKIENQGFCPLGINCSKKQEKSAIDSIYSSDRTIKSTKYSASDIECKNGETCYFVQIHAYYPAPDLEALVGTPDSGYKDYYALIMALGNKVSEQQLPQDAPEFVKKYPTDYVWWTKDNEVHGYWLRPTVNAREGTGEDAGIQGAPQVSGTTYYVWGIGAVSNKQACGGCSKPCDQSGASCRALPKWTYFSASAQPGTGAGWYLYLYEPSMYEKSKDVPSDFHAAVLPQTVHSLMSTIDKTKIVTDVVAAAPASPYEESVKISQNSKVAAYKFDYEALDNNIFEPLGESLSATTCDVPKTGQPGVEICKNQDLPARVAVWTWSSNYKFSCVSTDDYPRKKLDECADEVTPQNSTLMNPESPKEITCGDATIIYPKHITITGGETKQFSVKILVPQSDLGKISDISVSASNGIFAWLKIGRPILKKGETAEIRATLFVRGTCSNKIDIMCGNTKIGSITVTVEKPE